MKRIFYPAVSLLSLMFLLTAGLSTSCADVGSSDFVRIYYGADDSMSILDRRLEVPQLELTDEMEMFDGDSLAQGGDEGCFIGFDYHEQGDDTAVVTLNRAVFLQTFEQELETLTISGIVVDGFATSNVTLQGESALMVNGEATAVPLAVDPVESLVTAIKVDDGCADVALRDGSFVYARVKDVDSARVRGIDVGSATDGNAEGKSVFIGGESAVMIVAVADEDNGEAYGTGVKIAGDGDDTAEVSLENSFVMLHVYGAEASSFGVSLQGTDSSQLFHGAVRLDGSAIEAHAEGDRVVRAEAVGLYNIDMAEVSLDNGSMLESVALEQGESGDNNLSADGLLVYYGNSAKIKLAHESEIQATIYVEQDASTVSASAVYVADVSGHVDLELESSSKLLTGIGVDNSSPTYANGVVIERTASVAISLKEESSIAAGSLVYGDGADDSDAVRSWGMDLIDVNDLHISLDGSSVGALARSNGTGNNDVYANGINLDSVASAQIDLSNGAQIVVLAQTKGAGRGEAYGVSLVGGSVATLSLTNGSHIGVGHGADHGWADGVCAQDGSTLAVTVDATSFIDSGWAAYADNSTITVDNSGLLSGRLQVTELTNNPSGILQAKLGVAGPDSFIYQEDGFKYYSRARTATLADGSSVRIQSWNNIGLTSVGDSVDYAMLVTEPGGGHWNRDQLNLITSSPSPMLGLNWHEDSDADHLIVTTTFLNAQQAGLSANGSAAFRAAMTDDLFTFDSSPEQWVPDVSGAISAGMGQTINSATHSIDNRMGVVLGLNSGDATTAGSGLWFSMRFSDTEQDNRGHVTGFDADTTAMSIGFDRAFGGFVFGLAYTRGGTEADVDDNSAEFDMTDHLFSLYSAYDSGKWYGKAIVFCGNGNVESVRRIAGQPVDKLVYDIASIDSVSFGNESYQKGSEAFHSDYDADTYGARFEAGVKFNRNGWQLNPLLALDYSNKGYDAYTESGGSMALHVKFEDYDIFSAGLGVLVQKEFYRDWGVITPEIKALVNYDLANDRIVSTANFVGSDTFFVVKGIEPDETSWDFSAALNVADLGQQTASLRLGYDYSGRRDFAAHSFTCKVRFDF